MKIMITGHRPSRIKGKELEIDNWIKSQLVPLNNIEECINGICRGVDLRFDNIVMEMNLPLVCVIPFKRELNDVEKKFAEYSKEVFFFSDTFYEGVYEDRDKWMVNRSDIVLVVWDGNPVGGAYETMKYAQSQNKDVRIFEWKKS